MVKSDVFSERESYPCIKKDDISGDIILFTNELNGIILKCRIPEQVGRRLILGESCPNYKIFKGKVTLENQ